MTTLRLETLTMPAGELRADNPLPQMHKPHESHLMDDGEGLSQAMLERMSYGLVSSILPYTAQDDFTRERAPRDFAVATLENDHVRAAFLLGLGGRLWSLVDKRSGRELLEVNPVFQPCNLAIRGAWFSGGVEWNIGMTGHTPFTCAPLFAARARAPDGSPALRLYEFERIRQVTYQMDFYLPDASRFLYVRICIVNPNDHEVPMYWWSNIAVPETEDTRLLVPADAAYTFGYGDEAMSLVPVPMVNGRDTSYSTNSTRSGDFFYAVPEGHRKWIAAVDRSGTGLVQTSTDRLIGRKLFMWGMGDGGRKWQEFLSVPGRAYIELQAGLAHTQSERIPMGALAEWSWLEAYGMLETDPGIAHGDDWAAAHAHAEERLETLVPRGELDAEYARGDEAAKAAPEEILHRGSGWGALEALRREAAGERPLCSAALVFDEASIGTRERPWLDAMRGARFASPDVATHPGGYQITPPWRDVLERAVAEADADNWYAWLHLGVLRFVAEDYDGAGTAWERSRACAQSPWAVRNLGALARLSGDAQAAADLYATAAGMRSDLWQLDAECAQSFMDAGRAPACIAFIEALPPDARAVGRIQLLEAQARLAVGDPDGAERVLRALEVENLREGEKTLSNLWFAIQAERVSAREGVPVDDALLRRMRSEFPVPRDLDFRMSDDDV